MLEQQYVVSVKLPIKQIRSWKEVIKQYFYRPFCRLLHLNAVAKKNMKLAYLPSVRKQMKNFWGTNLKTAFELQKNQFSSN